MENKVIAPIFIKRIIKIVSLLLLLILLTGMNSDKANTALIKWALIIKDSYTKEETSANKNEIELKASQSFKFIFQPGENVFTYLYHYSNEEELNILYPDVSSTVHSGYFNTWHDVPPGLYDWFKLTQEQPGVETFYFIASAERQKNLESLTEKYIKSGKNKSGQKAVLEEILFLIKNNYPKEKIEEPVPITGLIKTDNTIIYAIKGVCFYAKVITIKPLLTE